jgi:ATP-dependent DNA ligase
MLLVTSSSITPYLLVLEGRDLRPEPLIQRRELLRSKVLPKLAEPIRYSPTLNGSLEDLIESVRQQRLEGLIAKRIHSTYESGERSGGWLKMRVNRGQEFVIGGYTPTPKNFDALVLGYYEATDSSRWPEPATDSRRRSASTGSMVSGMA